MLKSGSSELHMPEVSDIARMMSRKFSGSWNGSARIVSPNSIAKLRSSRSSTCCTSARPMPPKRANSSVIARSSSAVSADGSRMPTPRMLSTSRFPSRAATARMTCCRPRRSPSGTSPIMPKSMKVSTQAGRGRRRGIRHARGRRRGIRHLLDRRDEDVAGVRVGVEEAVAEELVEHDGRELLRDRLRVDARRHAGTRGR